ncbi:MAG: ParB/RepB/Spo0J family partition protein [Clostridia bacterium]|nr:ParB/RepB/Spo0J family partition protein [Clostridia bacterium]
MSKNIIPKKEKRENRQDEGAYGKVMMIRVDAIIPNPAQPRRFFTDDAILRLADSIRLHGIIQPLCVRCPDKSTGIYELVAGERRLRAAKVIGMREVPCITVEADPEESAHMAIVENIQRENLNMFEQAEAIKRLMCIHCLTQEKIAEKLSCSQSYVANKLRLLRLDSNEREEILSAALSERHARALLRLKDSESRLAAMHTVIRREMNVAQTEEYIDRLLEARKKEREIEKEKKKAKIILKDVRILYNTIDRAVETVRLSGIDVQTLKRETASDTEIVIKIPKGA